MSRRRRDDKAFHARRTAAEKRATHLEPSARRTCMLVDGCEASKSGGESLEKPPPGDATVAAAAAAAVAAG